MHSPQITQIYAEALSARISGICGNPAPLFVSPKTLIIKAIFF